jgi:hypothetical protein
MALKNDPDPQPANKWELTPTKKKKKKTTKFYA